jgi:hypothetical protein
MNQNPRRDVPGRTIDTSDQLREMSLGLRLPTLDGNDSDDSDDTGGSNDYDDYNDYDISTRWRGV